MFDNEAHSTLGLTPDQMRNILQNEAAYSLRKDMTWLSIYEIIF